MTKTYCTLSRRIEYHNLARTSLQSDKDKSSKLFQSLYAYVVMERDGNWKNKIHHLSHLAAQSRFKRTTRNPTKIAQQVISLVTSKKVPQFQGRYEHCQSPHDDENPLPPPPVIH